MTSQELKEKIIENFMSEYLMWDGTWEINTEGSVDVKGRIQIENYPYSKLPFKFRKIEGTFYCSGGYIETFENFPNIIEGDFCCSYNLLTSLKNFPKEIGGWVICQGNREIFTEKEIRKICNVHSNGLD